MDLSGANLVFDHAHILAFEQGLPIDVARVALFLASDDAAFVTGQAIAADGGLTLRV